MTHNHTNGLTFKDVSKIDYESSCEGPAIQLGFVCQNADMPNRIFDYAALQNKKGTVEISKGWDIGHPFSIE